MIKSAWPLFCLALVACDAAKPPAKPAASSEGAVLVPAASARVATSTAPSLGAPPAKAANDSSTQRPLYYSKPIGDAELEGRSLRELSLLRNTVYARLGKRFRRPWLDRHYRSRDWYSPSSSEHLPDPSVLDVANARKVAAYDAGLKRAALETMRDALLARRSSGRSRPEDAVESSLLSQRLGIWLGGHREGGAAPTPLEDHSELKRLVTVAELSTLSRRDLRILRNTIYARRGRMFDSAVVRGYFKTAAWYKPNPGYQDGMLTGVDHKNVAIIASVEHSLGGAEHENPNAGKDGWFFQA